MKKRNLQPDSSPIKPNENTSTQESPAKRGLFYGDTVPDDTPLRSKLANTLQSLYLSPNSRSPISRYDLRPSPNRKRINDNDGSPTKKQNLETTSQARGFKRTLWQDEEEQVEETLKVAESSQEHEATSIIRQIHKLTEEIKELTSNKASNDADDRIVIKHKNKEKHQLFAALAKEVFDALQALENNQAITLQAFLTPFLPAENQAFSFISIKDHISKLSFAEIVILLSKIAGGISANFEQFNNFLGKPNNNSKLSNAILQLRFEAMLSQLGATSYIPLSNLLAQQQLPEVRLVMTCGKESISGFELCSQYLDIYGISESQKLSRLQTDPLVKLTADLSNKQLVDFEMAWRHITANGKHNNVVFITSIAGLQAAISKCGSNSTLVIHGHGGGTKMRICDQDKKAKEHLKSIEPQLLDCLSHLELASCTTGILDKEVLGNSKVYSKRFNATENDADQKFRKRLKIMVDDSANVETMFEQTMDGGQYLAAEFAKTYFTREKQDSTHGSAFTFSPSILIPVRNSVSYGVPMCAERRSWPDYCDDWEKDQRVTLGNHTDQLAWKSVTLFDNYKNPKAPILNQEGELREWSKKQQKARV